MVEYNCPRCGYLTSKKSSMINHIKNKKKICRLVFDDIIPLDYAEEILSKKKSKIIEDAVIKNISDENFEDITTITDNIINFNLDIPYSQKTKHISLKNIDFIINKILNLIPFLIEKIRSEANDNNKYSIYIINNNKRVLIYNAEGVNLSSNEILEELMDDSICV